MSFNRHEKRLKKYIQLGHKNRLCKYLMIPFIFIDTIIYHIGQYLNLAFSKIYMLSFATLSVCIMTSFTYIDADDYDKITNKKSEKISLIESDVDISKTDEAISTIADISAFDNDNWEYVLINKQHPVPCDYEFSIGSLRNGIKCDERVVPFLQKMIDDAKSEGINLVVCSSYRNNKRQIKLFENKINRYMKKGYSYSESYKMTSQAVTIPGASEHEAGLAMDIVCKEYALLNSEFGDTDAGKWLEINSWKYGFIVRYPKDKEDITGIEYEPWHFRYVGKDAAEYINSNNLCLEEFVSIIN